MKVKEMTVIHPSRGRPLQAAYTVGKWLSFATNRKSFEYLISLDEDDVFKQQYLEIFASKPAITVIINNNRSVVDAINNAAACATGRLLVVVSDDFLCMQGWDQQLLHALNQKEDFCLKTNDGLQPWLITLPIMDRTYYNRFGYIYYPGYLHMFCDTEMTHVADLLERRIESDLLFSHLHYSTYRNRRDAISIRNESTWMHGERLYLQRVKNNFGLVDPPGQLRCDTVHLRWLQNKGVYAKTA
jgi:hypothetical protein